MIVLARIVLRLLADLAGLVVLSLRPRRSVEAENLFLRRQLALYQERCVKPRRVDAPTRVSLAVFSRLFDWRDALVLVRPETLIRWHRAGWRLFWRIKSRPGRPPIPLELRQLIRRMATENPIWGEDLDGGNQPCRNCASAENRTGEITGRLTTDRTKETATIGRARAR